MQTKKAMNNDGKAADETGIFAWIHIEIVSAVVNVENFCGYKLNAKLIVKVKQ